jgi:hypothetical protein
MYSHVGVLQMEGWIKFNEAVTLQTLTTVTLF